MHTIHLKVVEIFIVLSLQAEHLHTCFGSFEYSPMFLTLYGSFTALLQQAFI